MKKLFACLILFVTAKAYAVSTAIEWSTQTRSALLTGTTVALQVHFDGRSFDPPSMPPNTDFDADMSLAINTPNTNFWKRVGDKQWGPMTAQEQQILINDAVATSTTAIGAQALLGVDAFDHVSLAQRGFALVTLDEINTIRQWLASFKVEVAAAASLADLKTRVATLPNMPDRTKAQIIPAVKTKIQSGGAD